MTDISSFVCTEWSEGMVADLVAEIDYLMETLYGDGSNIAY